MHYPIQLHLCNSLHRVVEDWVDPMGLSDDVNFKLASCELEVLQVPNFGIHDHESVMIQLSFC